MNAPTGTAARDRTGRLAAGWQAHVERVRDHAARVERPVTDEVAAHDRGETVLVPGWMVLGWRSNGGPHGSDDRFQTYLVRPDGTVRPAPEHETEGETP